MDARIRCDHDADGNGVDPEKPPRCARSSARERLSIRLPELGGSGGGIVSALAAPSHLAQAAAKCGHDFLPGFYLSPRGGDLRSAGEAARARVSAWLSARRSCDWSVLPAPCRRGGH